MEPTSKEHVKYQFCNVYSDLLSDLKSISSVKPDSVQDSDDSEITLAPIPEKKKQVGTPVYKTRGRSRKNDSEDVFSELKAVRLKKKHPSDHQTDITASFNSSFDTADNDGFIKVAAEIHRDAEVQPAEVSTKKDELVTSDKIFDSLLNKKPNEIEINCSQDDSEDFFQVSKRSRKSYPGASIPKVNTLNGKRRLSRGSVNDFHVGKRNSCLDSNSDIEPVKKKFDKKAGSRTNNTLASINKSASTTISNSESDKLRSSPGWSRVKAVAKDFKDTTYKKPLNISISKPKQSSSKTSSSISIISKVENSSILNISTSDSDQSDVRYFDSPDAVKRCQLMKHIVETVEKNEFISTDEFSSTLDPSMKLLANSLKKERKLYVKKLIDSVNQHKSKKGDEENIVMVDDELQIKNQEMKEGSGNESFKPAIQNNGAQQMESPQETKSLCDSVKGRNQVKIAMPPDILMPDEDLVSKLNSDNSVVCIGEFDNDKPVESVTSNEPFSTCGKVLDVSSEKDSVLECSNHCDVSEAPLSRNQKSIAASTASKKYNTKSKELDDLLTQVLVTSTSEGSTPKVAVFEPTIPLSSSQQHLCFRCKCSILDSESSQSDAGNLKTKFSYAEEKKNVSSEEERQKTEQVDVSVQTDDVLVSEIHSTKEMSVQTSPTTQTVETACGKERSEENNIRIKDEFILQTLKTLMIQASHKLTMNDLYNLGFEQENEPPRKKLKEITDNHNQNIPRFDDDIARNENLSLQTWSFSANRGITNDSNMHPPSDLKTPQNQFIKRKISSDMKYSFVSTPSSSERKLLDDTKFLNRSTVCLKDVTICENDQVHPSEDSMIKGVVPMELEEDPSNIAKSIDNKTEVIDRVPNLEEIETSKLDIVRIRERINSSSSNDSMVLSSRKSVHRSLNFQNFFSKISDNVSNSHSSTRSLIGNSHGHFSSETNSNKHMNDEDSKKLFSFNSKIVDSNSTLNNQVDDKVDDMEYSEDIRKSLSVFPECMDTQKIDADPGVGIVENSDDESIIQATPKKIGPSTEASLTPDMLSSQNSQLIKEEGTDLHPVPKVLNNCESREGNIEAKPCQTDSDNSVTKHPNSNIDSQITEIPSSLVPTSEDYFSKRVERKNTFKNIEQLNQNGNQHVQSLGGHMRNHFPVARVINNNEGLDHGSISVSKPLEVGESSEAKRFFITTSGLPKGFLLGVQEFCKQFNCVYESEITERTTHLVVRTNNNKALSTMKFILAVAMHKLIVTVDWMSACSKAKEILPEDPYIPLSSSGQAGPLNSLIDKSNASPLFKEFIIHVVPPFSNFKKENLLDMLTYCGAEIAESYTDLAADKSRIRLVLVNNEGAEEKGPFYRGLVYRFKAFVLTHDWAIESVSNYKIEPFCNHNPLTAVYSFEMINYFQIPDYIKDQACRYFESNEDSYDDTVTEMSHLR